MDRLCHTHGRINEEWMALKVAPGRSSVDILSFIFAVLILLQLMKEFEYSTHMSRINYLYCTVY